MARSLLSTFMGTPKKRIPGVHSKKKTSSHKHSKNYVKKYKGQGR